MNETKFKSSEELKEYLSGNRLVCFLCGKSYINLGTHISYGHKMDISLYKEKYGIPQSIGLIGKEMRGRKSEIGKKHKNLFEKGHATESLAKKRKKQPDWCYDVLRKQDRKKRRLSLSEGEILEIFASKKPYLEISKLYSVGVGTVSRIKKKDYWFFKDEKTLARESEAG